LSQTRELSLLAHGSTVKAEREAIFVDFIGCEHRMISIERNEINVPETTI
jgi:hypothetical protein